MVFQLLSVLMVVCYSEGVEVVLLSIYVFGDYFRIVCGGVYISFAVKNWRCWVICIVWWFGIEFVNTLHAILGLPHLRPHQVYNMTSIVT
jgi:hypothetical protein